MIRFCYLLVRAVLCISFSSMLFVPASHAAERWWVGGTSGNWDGLTTGNWSATQGGVGGAGIPGIGDNVNLYTNSGNTAVNFTQLAPLDIVDLQVGNPCVITLCGPSDPRLTFNQTQGDILADNIFVGRGKYSQTGGKVDTLTRNGTITINSAFNSSFVAELSEYEFGNSAFSSAVLDTDSLFLMGTGRARFIQAGGAVTVGFITRLNGADTEYQLNGSDNALDPFYTTLSQSRLLIGNGRFIQNGGVHTVSTDILFDSFAGEAGVYDLSGGQLNAPAIQELFSTATSIFNIDGGTLTTSLMEVDTFRVGNAAGKAGAHTIASSSTVTTTSSIVGNSGTGIINNSGLHSTGTLQMGVNASAIGTYNLNGGALTVSGNITDGAGSSTLNVDGGTLSVAGGSISVDTLRLGNAAGTTGIHTLSGGDTISTTDTIIGNLGEGTFTNENGIHNVANALQIKNGSIYFLGSQGAVLPGNAANNPQLSTGSVALNGTLAQRQGVHAVANDLAIEGWYMLDQGSGDATVTTATLQTENTIVGNTPGGLARFTQGAFGAANSTFIHTVNTSLTLGQGVNTTGVYSMARGTLNVGGYITVGNYGRGNFSQTTHPGGGTTQVTADNLIIALQTGSEGIYNLSRGTLTTSGTQIGGLGSATFNQNGGTFGTNVLNIRGNYNLLATDATLTFNANNITIESGGVLTADAPGTVTANTLGVHNEGEIKVEAGTTLNFTSSVLNHGAINLDPATIQLTDITNSEVGYITGGVGDSVRVSGDWINNSTENMLWNTGAASLFIDGAGPHAFYLAGEDLGETGIGYIDNFSWGELALSSGTELNLWDGNAGNSGAALYVGLFALEDGISQLSLVNSTFNIYYDMLLPGNAYLQGADFALAGGGSLIAASSTVVPVPAAIWLFGSGLIGLIGLSGRKEAVRK